MKEKKLKNWIRLQRKRREASRVVSGIHFIPGVPTEDGWYVVKVTDPRGEYYAIAKTLHGMLMSIAPDINGEHTILSHAKLPEL